MTNKEAIRILHDLHNQWCQMDNIYYTDATGAICEALDMAMDALEKKDWILCKDKLPELGDLVWVTNNRRGIDVCYMDETCWRDRLDEWRYSLDGIVAWQSYEEPWPYEEK